MDSRYDLESWQLHAAARGSLRRQVATFRPLQFLEAIGLALFLVFFLYFGLHFSGLAGLLGISEMTGRQWVSRVCLLVSSGHVLNVVTRHWILKKFLIPEYDALLDQIDANRAALAKLPSQQDYELIRAAFSSMKPVFFRGDYGFAWSLGIGVFFFLLSLALVIRGE